MCALAAELIPMFPHEVTITPYGSEDAYGKREKLPSFTAHAQYDYGDRRTAGHFQETATLRARGFLNILQEGNNPLITTDCELQLPAPIPIRKPVIVESTPVFDETGDLCYWEVGVGDRDRS